MHGVITGIDHGGTVVRVWVTTDAGRTLPVCFDHRMFGHVAAARGPRRILGRVVAVQHTDCREAVRFDDDDASRRLP